MDNERQEFLSKAACIYSQTLPSISRHYLYLVEKNNYEENSKSVPTSYCQRCLTVYVPGGNCRVSFQHKGKVLIGRTIEGKGLQRRFVYYHCNVCSTTTKHAIEASPKNNVKKVIGLDRDVGNRETVEFGSSERSSSKSSKSDFKSKKPGKKKKSKSTLENLLKKKEVAKASKGFSLDDFLSNL